MANDYGGLLSLQHLLAGRSSDGLMERVIVFAGRDIIPSVLIPGTAAGRRVLATVDAATRGVAAQRLPFAIREDLLRVEHRTTYWIRSIVSTTCQMVEELNATERHQEANLFEWLEFL